MKCCVGSMADSRVSALLSAFRRLTVSASVSQTGAAVQVDIQSEPEPEQEEEAPPPTPVVSSSPTPAQTAPVAPLPAWVHTDKAVRWYLVWRVPGNPQAEGLWVGRHPRCWDELSRPLPGGSCVGSGANLRRYYSLQEAEAAWSIAGPRPHPTEPFEIHLVV